MSFLMVKLQIVQQIIFIYSVKHIELFSKNIETNHFIKRMM